MDRLAADVAGTDLSDSLAAELRDWMAGSRRFRAFVEAHRDKVRKKLRGAVDPDARLDVRAELLVAFRLLGDRRLDLAFEAYGARRPGPDFTITLRGERAFNLEVTRVHRVPSLADVGPILPKLRQLPPSVPNALLIMIPGSDVLAFAPDAAVRSLRSRADAGDDTFFAARNIGSVRTFHERLQRLGAVFVWADSAPAGTPATAWINRAARIAFSERATRVCVAALDGPA